ncbi:DNA polymerase III epsilon subunit (EC [Amycolatopsis camponoti]|uniref:DNA polymerase III epsilon subunit (EC) n=1 Tax=Amycolatopsis camponoti TaxID=2606593 RepID=A0A6I8LNI8_9PSEU|nr:exonuclease domain-containing protein [Amycolatopsis camponoti]VVJ17245.1 DNA polymerase III epsilon subunit (EC [Amycolatopsis camponoti]
MTTARGYAVIDTETTGILTGWHHRIAEIAVVHVDPHGNITDDWVTLVNPDRDLGPQAIHGIRAADARRAPRFEQLAGDLVERLAGRVVVAHNWTFDAMHLRAEFGRLGIDTPFAPDAGLCTMRAAGRARLSSGRSLIDCCAAAGLPERAWHTALDDARGAGELLGFLLRHAPSAVGATDAQLHAANWAWAHLERRRTPAVHRAAIGQIEPHFLAKLVERMPRDGEPVVDAYYAMLDDALLDRQISATEGDALVEIAHDLGLHKNEVVALHLSYLRDLAREAWADQVVTDGERNDLLTVATLLALDPAIVESILDEERDAVRDPAPDREHKIGGLVLRPGDKVVLTGDMKRQRADIAAEATAAGIRVTGAVSKQTRVLAAADPDSMSGKAKRAHECGVPVVSEDAFLKALAKLASHPVATRTP